MKRVILALVLITIPVSAYAWDDYGDWDDLSTEEQGYILQRQFYERQAQWDRQEQIEIQREMLAEMKRKNEWERKARADEEYEEASRELSNTIRRLRN